MKKLPPDGRQEAIWFILYANNNFYCRVWSQLAGCATRQKAMFLPRESVFTTQRPLAQPADTNTGRNRDVYSIYRRHPLFVSSS